jgi:hypothetical protein
MTRAQALALLVDQPRIPESDTDDPIAALLDRVRPTWWSRLCARVRARFS